MAAHYTGQVVNLSELGRSFGVADTSVRRYLEILKGTFTVRLLQPWAGNTGKRLVKQPRLYIRDTGLLHALLGLTTRSDVLSHPKVGGSWETFVVHPGTRTWPLAERVTALSIGNLRACCAEQAHG